MKNNTVKHKKLAELESGENVSKKTSIKPLKLIQNAAARLIFNEPKRTHVQGSKFTFLLGSTGAPNFKKLGAPQLF